MCNKNAQAKYYNVLYSKLKEDCTGNKTFNVFAGSLKYHTARGSY